MAARAVLSAVPCYTRAGHGRGAGARAPAPFAWPRRDRTRRARQVRHARRGDVARPHAGDLRVTDHHHRQPQRLAGQSSRDSRGAQCLASARCAPAPAARYCCSAHFWRAPARRGSAADVSDSGGGGAGARARRRGGGGEGTPRRECPLFPFAASSPVVASPLVPVRSARADRSGWDHGPFRRDGDDACARLSMFGAADAGAAPRTALSSARARRSRVGRASVRALSFVLSFVLSFFLSSDAPKPSAVAQVGAEGADLRRAQADPESDPLSAG